MGVVMLGPVKRSFEQDLTLVLEFFFLEAGLLAPVPFLNPIFSSDKTRCCSSSDRLWKVRKKIDIMAALILTLLNICLKIKILTLRNLFISISYSFFL